jgi:hypothetical protein
MWSGDALTRLDQPVFQFRTRFDLVAVEETVFALGSFAFDQLFREVPLSRVKPLVTQLSSAVPLAPGSAKVLEQKGLASARVRNRLRILMSRPHVKQITAKGLERVLRKNGISTSGIIANGRFVVDESRPTLLLELLDEDVWRGGFTGTLFASERKAPRE